MSDNKKKFEQEAEAFFADKKNSNFNTVYATSDGSLFRAEHYADNWKTQLLNKEVEVYHRNPVKAEVTPDQELDNDQESNSSNDSTSSTGNVREDLVKQYIELFDTKPAHNISLEKLQDKITAKRLEIAEQSGEEE